MTGSTSELVSSIKRRAVVGTAMLLLATAVVVALLFLLRSLVQLPDAVFRLVFGVVVAGALGGGAILAVRGVSKGVGLADRRTALGRRQRDPDAATWGPGTSPDPSTEIRVRPAALGSPSPERMIANAAGVGGRPQAVTRETGSTFIFDPTGVRLLWPGGLNFAVRWAELAHVSLQVVQGSTLMMTRLVLWPRDPGGFAGVHPELELVHGVGGLGPAGWTVSLGVDRQVDAHVLDGARRGLGYAGALFSGVVDQVREPPGA